MFRLSRFVWFLLLLPVVLSMVILTGTGGVSSVGSATVTLKPFLSGLNTPVNLVSNGAPNDERLFVVQQGGVIRVVNPNGTLRTQPFLNITDRVDDTNFASGLFGLAFHPNYANNGYFYVYYIHRQGETRYNRLSRFKVSTDPNVANPSSEHILLTAAKSVTEIGHNAGDLHFGPDGYLYFPLGDGNNSNTTGRPQDLTSPFGKMLRINVNKKAGEGVADCKGQGSGEYSIPPGNPYVGSPTACDEVWASGLRNPWRFSFDRQTGDLYLSDIGEDEWDELNFLANGAAGGRNYGWPCYEGNAKFEAAQWPNRGCSSNVTYTSPVITLPIGSPKGDCSLTGGFVYRGSRYPNLFGRYIMSDYCSGWIRDVVRNGNNWTVTLHDVSILGGAISFGQGNDGELYVLNRTAGTVFRVVGQESSTTSTPVATSTVTPPVTTTTTPSPSVTPSETVVMTPSATPTTTLSPSVTPSGTVVVTPTVTLTTTPIHSEYLYLPVVLDVATWDIPIP